MYLSAEFCQHATLPYSAWDNGRLNPVESLIHAVETVIWNSTIRSDLTSHAFTAPNV